MSSGFLKITEKVHNAVMLMADLAERQDSGSLVSLAEVAEARGLSGGFLEEVAAPLRQTGLIIGKRGAGGGYALARAASEISVADVVEAVEGPVVFVECQGRGCAISRRCGSKRVWDKVQVAVVEAMRGVTLRDLIV